MNRKELTALIVLGRATPEQLAEAGHEMVNAIKASNKLQQFREQYSPGLVKAGKVDDDSRTISWIASTESVDRMGDIIRVKGWDLKSYRANPIALLQHNPDWPIGTSKVSKGELPGGGKALFSDITFASAEASELAQQTFLLAKEKVLRGNSVGFIGRQTRRPENEEERVALGLGEYGVEFLKQELVEDSVVSVPANPDAVTLALRGFVELGTLSQDQADVFAHKALSIEPKDAFDNIRRSMFEFGSIGDELRAIFDAEEDAAEDEPPTGDQTGEPTGDEPPTGDQITERTAEELIGELADEALMEGADYGDQVKAIITAAQAQAELSKGDQNVKSDEDLVKALTNLVTTQTEQLAATRQLADTVNDLARKVLELTTATGPSGAGGDELEAGDEEIDPETLRSIGAALTRFSTVLTPNG